VVICVPKATRRRSQLLQKKQRVTYPFRCSPTITIVNRNPACAINLSRFISQCTYSYHSRQWSR